MADLNKINVSLLCSYENSFEKEYNRFNSKTYTTFKSSYLNSCSDSNVIRMNRALDNLYTKIKNSYKNIDKWWKDYNNDIKSLENCLSDNGSPGSILEVSVRNIAYNLPKLKKYNIKHAGIIPSSIITRTYDTSLLNSPVFVPVDSFKDVGTNISEKAENVFYDVLNFGYGIYDWFESEFLPWQEEACETVWGVIKSVGATVAVAIQSLVEGVLQFGEAIVDFLALAGGVVATIFTGTIDLGQAIHGLLSGEEWNSITKSMWSDVKGFVTNQYVSGWFDSLYQNTEYGKWITNNAYGMDITRSIGSGIGYVAGVVVLTIATFGVGGAVAAGGSATATSAAAATTATQTAVTATAAGIGKGTQNAWGDGAGTLEGLATGTLSGIWEGIQFFLGGKISKFTLKGLPEKNIVNSLARVVLDGADGGVEGFVMPLINSVYKDGYYDDKGNYIEFLESDNFKTRYNEIFKDNGGWSSVLSNAVIGAGSSILGESFDLRKYFKDSKNVELSSKVNNKNPFTEMLSDKNKNYNALVADAKSKLYKLDQKLVKLYVQGKATGINVRNFIGYEEHNFVHVTRVAEESAKIVSLINANVANLDGYGRIDADVVYKAGLAHDLGMKSGGYVLFDDGTFVKIDDVVSNFEQFSSKTYNKGKILSKSTLENVEGDLIRSQHPLNSAISVLQNREVFGENVDLIAILALSHSKSTSGVKNIMNVEQLSSMVRKLYENQENGNYRFDISKILKCDANGNPLEIDNSYVFASDVVEQIRSGSIALRAGDAHALKTGFNHGGEAILIESLEDLECVLYSLDNNDYTLSDLCKLEADKSVIKIVSEEQEIELIKNKDMEFSKRIILGEKNTYVSSTDVVDGVLTYTHIVKSNTAPACTWLHGIEEKFGEYATYNNLKQSVVIELPKDAPVEIREFYNSQAKKNEKDWLQIIVK